MLGVIMVLQYHPPEGVHWPMGVRGRYRGGTNLLGVSRCYPAADCQCTNFQDGKRWGRRVWHDFVLVLMCDFLLLLFWVVVPGED